MAYAHRYLNGTDVRIACLLSDGECNEGSVWEAALFAAHHQLRNLTVLIDANGFQGFGPNREVLNLESFSRKWDAFGFAVSEIDGHDFAQLDTALGKQDGAALHMQPRCILCRTIKGKGVSFMENTMEWHYLTMTPEQYQKALAEVEAGTGIAGFAKAA
jgi:transketolase